MPTLIRLFISILVLLAVSPVTAQLCQGSLGDPIVNIDFGAGANPGASLPTNKTSFNYISTDCPSDGSYTILNRTNGCFGNTWHSITQDHTGNTGGYFMLVNASFQPSQFYVDTVKGLCSNTNFEFAAWIMNVLRPNACNGAGLQPNLTFTIEKLDGTVLQTYQTGTIASDFSATWKQYGFFFATPPGVFDVVLRIFNNSPGGCGNDLALDDITFRPCGPLVSAFITNEPTNDVVMCNDQSKSYTLNCAVSSGFANPIYQWQTSRNNAPWSNIPLATGLTYNASFVTGSDTGTYRFRLAVAESGNAASSQCRVLSPTFSVKVARYPDLIVSSNSPVCQEGLIELKDKGGKHVFITAPNGITSAYTTQGGHSGTLYIPNAQFIDSGNYLIKTYDNPACAVDTVVTVIVSPRPIATINFPVVSICEDESIQLEATGGTNYEWFPATGLSSVTLSNPLASPKDTIRYSRVAFNNYGCSDTTSTEVNVMEKPRVNAGPDKMLIEGGKVQLTATVSGQAIKYIWSPLIFMNDATLLRPMVNPSSDMEYTLRAVSDSGCGEAFDVVKVKVFKKAPIPNAFSPNGDGRNDTWGIPILNSFPEAEVSVFNRYGQLVYHCANNYKPWDGRVNGTMQPTGVFVYVIDMKQSFPPIKGTLTLIR